MLVWPPSSNLRLPVSRVTAEQLELLVSKPGYGIASSVGGRAVLPPRDSGKTPELERDSGDGALGQVCLQKETGGRFLVRVKSYRVRLLDEDNLCEKFAVDLCRHAGALPSDAAGKAKIEVSQEKVSGEANERVEITITRLA